MQQTRGSSSSRVRSVVFCGLAIALITVSAWISIPVGLIPVTLQIFSVAFILLVLKPKEALATIVIYLLLGAIGLPVFSSMRGGVGVLFGPTGGFLWGYVLGGAAALLVLYLARKQGRSKQNAREQEKDIETQKRKKVFIFLVDFVALLVYLIISYLCGWLYFMALSGLSPLEAFLTAIVPFIAIDILKLIVAVITANAVRLALPKHYN